MEDRERESIVPNKKGGCREESRPNGVATLSCARPSKQKKQPPSLRQLLL
jgi:hypothetical protein